MARASTTKTFYSFNGGINTEANPANYPENASLDALNVDINSNGVVSRRKTLDSEGGKVGSGIPVAIDDYRNTFYWKNVGNSVGRTFIVQQFNETLYFFDLIGDNAGSNFLNTLDLPTASGAFSFSVIDGDLVVADPAFNPKTVSYSAPNFTATGINIRVRDFEGIDDGLAVDEQPIGPKESFKNHWYNLKNQGWDNGRIDTYQAARGRMPSNSQVHNIAKNGENGDFTNIEAGIVDLFDFGTSPASKGRSILGISNPSLDRQIANPDIFPTPDLGIPTTANISIVSTFASRIFYAQSATNINPSRILYSQIPDTSTMVEKFNKYGTCYQKNDPTADTFNSLLETDGGVIEIQDMGEVSAMSEIQGSLVILSNKGVWVVSGAESGFSATNLQVKKISTIGANKKTSVVFTGDGAFYYSGDSIYSIIYDSISLVLSVINVSSGSVKTLLRTTFSNHDDVFGIFDKVSNKAIWLFQNNDPAGHSGTIPLDPDHLLILDLASGAFTRYELGRVLKTLGVFTAGIVAVEEGEVPSPVQVSKSPFANAVSTDLLNIKLVFAQEIPSTLFLGISNFNGLPGGSDTVGGGSIPENAFRDSRLFTGPQTLGDSSRDKDVLYLTTVFNRTENEFKEVATDNIILTDQSSCLGRIYWDWTDGKDNRVSPVQQLYRLGRVFVAPDSGTRFDYGKGVITTKTKMRGAGKAFSFSFSSEKNKDFQLVGWSIESSVGGAV